MLHTQGRPSLPLADGQRAESVRETVKQLSDGNSSATARQAHFTCLLTGKPAAADDRPQQLDAQPSASYAQQTGLKFFTEMLERVKKDVASSFASL